jgi:hypothetical protein
MRRFNNWLRRKEQRQSGVYTSRGWKLETVLVAVLLEHEKRVGEMVKILGELAAGRVWQPCC